MSFVYFLRLLFWEMVALFVLHILFFPDVHAGGGPGIIFVFCLFSQTLILGNGGSLSIMCFLFFLYVHAGGEPGIIFVFCLFSQTLILGNGGSFCITYSLFFRMSMLGVILGSFLSFADFTIFLC